MINNLFYAAIILQLLDVATTYYALTKIAGTYEINSFAAKIMAKIGLAPVLLIKLALAGGILFWARAGDYSTLVLGAACAGYLFVVVYNLKSIRRATDG